MADGTTPAQRAGKPPLEYVRAKELQVQNLTEQAEKDGRDTKSALGLVQEAKQAWDQGNAWGYLDLLDQAIASLGTANTATQTPAGKEPPKQESLQLVAAPGGNNSEVIAKLEQSQRLLEEAVAALRGGSMNPNAKPQPAGTGPTVKPVADVSRDFNDAPFGFHPARVDDKAAPYEYAKNIGVKWDRSCDFIWGEVQNDLQIQSYVWDRPLKQTPSYDERVRSLPDDMHLLANFSAVPYTRPDCAYPVDAEKYAAFVRTVVERYDGDGVDDMPGLRSAIKYWMVSNEPLPGPDSDYPAVLKLTYDSIKQVDPTAYVVAAGPIAVPDATGSFLSGMCKDYRRYFLDPLNARCFDVFDFHFYGTAKGDYRKIEAVYRYLRAALDENRLANVPIWITEMGTYSGEPIGADTRKVMLVVEGKSTFQSEELHAADVLKRYVFPLALGVKKVFLAFGMKEGYGTFHDDYFDCTGFVFDGLGRHDRGKEAKKLAYYTYKMMTEKLEGSDWDHVQTVPLPMANVYGYRFNNRMSSKVVHVLWWDWFNEQADAPNGQTRNIRLPCDKTKATLTVAVTGYSGERTVREIAASNGFVTVAIGAHPVFLE